MLLMKLVEYLDDDDDDAGLVKVGKVLATLLSPGLVLTGAAVNWSV